MSSRPSIRLEGKVAAALLAALVAAGGCRREAEAPPAALAPEAPAETSAEAPYVATRERLDAFVRYQRRMLAVQADLLAEMRALSSQLDAGAVPEAAGESVARSMQALERKARAEAQVRAEGGLSEADVNALSRLVMDVISQRHLAGLLDYPGEVRELERRRAALPAEQARELEAPLEAARRQARELDALIEARAAHGDANVDLVLAREAELLDNYRAMLQSFGRR